MSWEVPAGGSGSLGFTCTGLGYDGTNLLIGDFTNSRIVKTTNEGVYVGEIILGGSPPASSVQGVAYDTFRGHYWVAHYAVDGSGSIRRYNGAGVLQDTFAAPDPGPNGITYDAANDRVLAMFTGTSMLGYNAATGAVDETLAISGDGIEIDPNDANQLWISIDGTPCIVRKVNRTTGGTTLSWEAPLAVEDITFINGVLYLACDQEFHHSIPNGNRIHQFAAATGVELYMALTDDLISFWSLGEVSGTRADDVVASANDLADNNTVTQVAGKVGNAAQFVDANSEYLSRADNASLSVGDIDFTFAFWVYLDTKGIATTIRSFINKWNSTIDQREYLLDFDVDTDRFRFAVSAAGTSGVVLSANNFGSPSTGTWYLIVGWHNSVSDTINIQINNGTADSAAHTTGVFNGSSAFLLGSFNALPALYHDGRLDQVGFWKRVLTTDEKTFLYNAGAGRTYAEVVTGLPTFQAARAKGSNILL